MERKKSTDSRPISELSIGWVIHRMLQTICKGKSGISDRELKRCIMDYAKQEDIEEMIKAYNLEQLTDLIGRLLDGGFVKGEEKALEGERGETAKRADTTNEDEGTKSPEPTSKRRRTIAPEERVSISPTHTAQPTPLVTGYSTAQPKQRPIAAHRRTNTLAALPTQIPGLTLNTYPTQTPNSPPAPAETGAYGQPTANTYPVFQTGPVASPPAPVPQPQPVYGFGEAAPNAPASQVLPAAHTTPSFPSQPQIQYYGQAVHYQQSQRYDQNTQPNSYVPTWSPGSVSQSNFPPGPIAPTIPTIPTSAQSTYVQLPLHSAATTAYLGFSDQHRIMTTLQNVMEKAFFDFLSPREPQLCQDREWTCVERVELNEIARLLMDKRKTLWTGQMKDAIGKPVGEVLTDMISLRNQTVHRHRMTVARMDYFLHSAQAVAWTLLQDQAATKRVTQLRNRVYYLVGVLPLTRPACEARRAGIQEEMASRYMELNVLSREMYDIDMKQ